jgi:hypothetical protein
MTADRRVVLVLRALSLTFVVVGALFLLAPDATLRSLDASGALLGDFAATPPTGARLWLSLAVAYMVLVALLAWLAQRDLAQARPYLALLFAGKASSSLIALLAYRTVAPCYPYLANFVIDGAIALGVAAIWQAAPRLAAEARAGSRTVAPGPRGETRILRGLLEALAPPAGAIPPEAAADVEAFVRRTGARAGFRLLLRVLDLSPFVLPPLWFRRTSRLPLEDRVRVLEAWEDSRLWPRRQALAALKTVALTHVYARPETLRRLGYEDPLVRVPLADDAAAQVTR